ncbi:FG-GAP repeat domain-containing protein, partial [Streptomyces sp. NPDC059578]|uniref:FG-GAP repeat domain-containing protein n=1 Tax=Streptomyces sp. NPDC059578 TaxID=3346874 RepID=UPI0036AFC29B
EAFQNVDGKGAWTKLGQVATGSTQWSDRQVRFADLNGDGRADYLVVGPNGSVEAFQNVDGKGAWTKLGQVATGSTQWSDRQVRFADLNGDGRADYLVVGPNGSVEAHQNVDGAGTWTKLGQVATGSTQWSDLQVRI